MGNFLSGVDFSFNAGRFGFSSRELIARSYRNLEVSAEITGFMLGAVTPEGVLIYDRNNKIVQRMTLEEMVSGKDIAPNANQM